MQVFSNPGYAAMAAAVFSVMFLALSAVSEFVFFEPYFVFYVPADRAASFAALVAVTVLSGVVIPMNLYRVVMLQSKTRKISGGLFGSIVGASAGACSCGPVGFAIVSTFGTVGGLATSFVTTYEMPLRLVSICILGFVYLMTAKSIKAECRIK